MVPGSFVRSVRARMRRMATDVWPRLMYRSGDGRITWADDDRTLREALADKDGLVWLDLTVHSYEDASVLRDVFAFHELTIEDCVSARVDPARVDDYGDYLFLIVQAITEYVPDMELEPVEVDFYLGPNYVVSCHRKPIPAIEQFRERCRRDERQLHRTPDWVLHGIVDAIVDEFLPIVDEVDETIDKLEEEILGRPDTALMRRILVAKRNALQVRRATVPQRDVIYRLSRGEFPKFIRSETAMYYRDVFDHLTRIEYLIDSVRDLADGALNVYLSVASNRLNEIVRVLTAVTLVFLPPTLFAAIYGMNFPAGAVWPPYDSDWGFSAIVATIVIMIMIILAYFRLRRWI
jgi:magnesium transporter